MDSWLDPNIIEEGPHLYVGSNTHVLCRSHFRETASYTVNDLTVPLESRDKHGCYVNSATSTTRPLTLAKDIMDIVCRSGFHLGCVDREMCSPPLALIINGESICMLPMAPIDGIPFVNI
jgi:hypothetical protein